MFKFGKANAKLVGLEKRAGIKVSTFSILSGHDCPYAKECRSQAVENNGKLTILDGEHTVFRCFSASQEVLFPTVYKSRKYNSDKLRECLASGIDCLIETLHKSLPKKSNVIRWHVAGDFFVKNYFLALNEVAKRNPDKIFYAYTKSLPFWVALKKQIADNFILTASYGGFRDDLIQSENLRFAKVVFSIHEADELGLEIDHDDFHAYNPDTKNQSFALLIHGTQPKGSKAGKAVQKLAGVGSYGRGDS